MMRDDPVTEEAVTKARMRLSDIAELLILVTDYASPHEIMDINRRVREPRISKMLDAALCRVAAKTAG
jgi:hypothetical protein